MDDKFLRGTRFTEHVVGIIHIRDTKYPCEFFVPCDYGSGRGRCDGDGHYMCRECEEHDEIQFKRTNLRAKGG
jgi:hypothetical protein